MGILRYFFSFHGRINRAKFVLSLLIMVVWIIAFWSVIIVGFDWSATIHSVKFSVDKEAETFAIDFSKAVLPPLNTPGALKAIAVLAVMEVFAIWFSLAIYAKRLHDRNKSAWWLLLYWLAPAVLSLYALTTFFPVFDTSLPLWGSVASDLSTLISFWVLLEFCFFRGTQGPNRFGNDPLEKGAPFCEPGKPVKGCIPRGTEPA